MAGNSWIKPRYLSKRNSESADKISQLIQVVHTLGDEGTRNRELRSLIKAMEETGLYRGEIITYEGECEL